MEHTIEIGREILYLTSKDVLDIGLTEEEVYNLVEGALAEHGRKNCEMPVKIGLHPLHRLKLI
ncbi:hypothetical protein FJZ31_23195 [Candidatus Poribacteria bacterium]|nr:hypothetical protein [Candidatus Poribacteria bacterium]